MKGNGKMSGRGIMTPHNGSKFVGQFKEGRKQGFGVHVFEAANIRERLETICTYSQTRLNLT
jgi:hypothetical protein